MSAPVRTDIPPVDSPNFLEKVREALSVYLGYRGDPLNKGVTVGDLINSNIAVASESTDTGITAAATGGAVTNITNVTQVTGSTYTPDLTPPPSPSGFSVVASIGSFIVTCDLPTYTVGHGHQKSRLYGSTAASPVFANASLLTEFTGSVGSYATDPATTWHLWLTWVSVDGVESLSPTGGTNGASVTTAQDVTKLVTALTGTGNPFTVVTSTTSMPDGSVVPPGTYTSDAYIRNGQIDTAKIANAAITDAKMVSVSADKLVAGTIAVGQYIQSTGYTAGSGPTAGSGWRIDGNGNLNVSNATVRGTVYATAGQVGGNTIDSTGMQSPSYVAMSSGWRLDSSGVFRAFASSTNYIDMAATGSNSILKFGTALDVKANGTATFGGTLAVQSAASGARMTMANNVIKVYDTNGIVRVQIGDLSA